MGKPRRKFSPEYKAKLVLEMLAGKRSVAEIARAEQIKDAQLYEWRAEAIEKLPLLFSLKTPEQHTREREQELEQLIGQLTIENQALKKASRTPAAGCPWPNGLSRKSDGL